MSFKRCPGSMAFAQPKIELVRCPGCGDDVEVWTDEAQGKCPKCGRAVCRTTTQSCIDWCKYARECLGDEGHKKYQDMKTRLRKETLLKAAEGLLPDDRHRQLARARLEFAEQILRREAAADPNVVIAAAALIAAGQSDVPSADSQAQQGPSMATEVLHELGYPEGFIKEVAGILLHLRSPDEDRTINFRVVHDADLLAAGATATRRTELLKRFLTEAGRALAPR